HSDFHPADPAGLHLYDSRQQRDVLVVYQEVFKLEGSMRSRSYWLYANEDRISQERRPRFVDPKRVDGLTSIPIFSGANLPDAPGPELLYAVALADHGFALRSGGRELSSHVLPVYDEAQGPVARVLLTPLALTFDLVGGGVYLWLKEHTGDE